MDAILKTAKRDDTTPVPFLAVLIANAYRNLYPVGEKTIAIGCAVDYRPLFHDDCRNNAAGNVVFPYFSKIAQFDLPTQRTIMRARLDLETQEENLIAGLTPLAGMDVEMPYLNGIAAAQKLRQIDEKVALIYVTNYM